MSQWRDPATVVPHLAGESDLNLSPDFLQTIGWFEQVWQPGYGKPFGPVNLDVSPDGGKVAFAADVRTTLESSPQTKIGVLDIDKRFVETIDTGRQDARHPRYSPEGRLMAFLCRAESARASNLVVTPQEATHERVIIPLDGHAEYLEWSPTGRSLLVGLTGPTADQSAELGSGLADGTTRAGWQPLVDIGDSRQKRRSVQVINSEAWRSRFVSPPWLNIWEAVWISEHALAVLYSSGGSESDWYRARFAVLDLTTSVLVEDHAISDQAHIGGTSPNGRFVLLIEGLASDREVVAGQLVLFDTTSGSFRKLEQQTVDVTDAHWRDDETILFIGHQRELTVVAELTLGRGTREIWSGEETSGRSLPSCSPAPGGGAYVIIESWSEPPEIAVVRAGEIERLTSFGHGGTDFLAECSGIATSVTWTARDGRDIQGWLVEARGDGPKPTILEIHGGPVWASRNRWSARNIVLPLLVSRGYSVLMPNFRGSIGWGSEFISLIRGDMGGEDLDDCLAGVDFLIDTGMADPSRLGVMGGSYGGFATSLIVSRTDRFRAAVALSPVTDWVSHFRASNLRDFDQIFLNDELDEARGTFFQRSPVWFGSSIESPLLTVAGGEDRSTPADQAWQMHNVLINGGHAPSALVVYPHEGHGVKNYPAVVDYCTRVRAWFEHFMTPA